MGDISLDPLFADRDYGELHIRPGSPCVNAGWNDATGTSVRGHRRPGSGAGGTVDIGADESDGTDPPVAAHAIVRVSPEGDDANDGSSWTLAKRTVQAGIDAASAQGGEVWVKAGTVQRTDITTPIRVSLWRVRGW